MKRSLSLFVLSSLALMVASSMTASRASAANETVVVVRPPAAPSPIPIPYPNTSTSQPQSLSGFKGFFQAAAATNGIVDVVSLE